MTGGAGFIGSALVRHARPRERPSVVNLDKLTYAANLAIVAEVDGDAADTDSSTPTSATRRRSPSASSTSIGRRGHASGRREPCRPLDRRSAASSSRPMSSAPPRCCRPRCRILARACGRRTRRASASTMSRPTRCTAHSASRTVHRGDALRPNLALFGEQGGADHLVRAWHETYGLPVVITNCSNNYGPYQFPGKADPADDHQRARGEAAAGLRPRRERPRLAVRRGSCAGAVD